MNEAQRQRVLAACQTAKKQDKIEIIRGDWGVEWSPAAARWVPGSFEMCSCALGCLLLQDQPARPFGENAEGTIAELLGCSKAEVNAFIEGFDDGGPGTVSAGPVEHQAWFEAGYRTAVDLGLVNTC